MVILATYGEVDALLTADSETDVTAPLLSRRIEILKVAHHGSADAGLASELRELRPEVAVISCGRNNDYGHPRPSTVAALRASPGLSLYRTDEDGRVVVESDGKRITVRKGR
jgi:competence protein ComEC